MQDQFNHTRLMRFLGWLVHSQANLWIDVGKLETRLLKGRLKPVQAPVYVTGLARAGTTLLLSVLESHHRCTSFKYCDYYGAFTPYLADRVFRAAGLGTAQKSERAHDDGMLVNAYSPEAMEEVIWMQFFDYLHTTDTSNVVAAATEHPEFETVYRATLQKLLLCRRAERIVCKNNYNITRIAYLGRLFADARFVLAVREPVDHIASIMRQHQINLERYSTPHHLDYLRNAGHFEFGRGRIPITAAVDATRRIEELWDQGRDVEGWAEYWNAIYAWTYKNVLGDAKFKDRCTVVPFERLCAQAEAKITDILAFCNLDAEPDWVRAWGRRIDYKPKYEAPFSAAEREMIADICGATAALYGY